MIYVYTIPQSVVESVSVKQTCTLQTMVYKGHWQSVL